MYRHALFGLLLFHLAGAWLYGAETPEIEPFHLNKNIEKQEPMNTQGMETRLAGILDRHYQRAFGGLEGWQALESLKFQGRFSLPNGREFEFTALKKKPDFSRIVLAAEGGETVIMAYDGEDAWQMATARSNEALDMPVKDAVKFVRDAPLGSHLLYPQLPGKRVELLGTVKVDEEICFEIEVELPNGQIIRYALDAGGYTIVRQSFGPIESPEEVVYYSDYRRVEGVTIAYANRTEQDGRLVSEVVLDRVGVNRGVMPWMFSRRTEAYLPTGRNP